MSFVTDMIRDTGFPQGWTVFYFAWWVVYSMPFGMFIAKISRGRTIRELVMGGLICGSLGCIMFYMVLPGFGIHLQTTGQADLMTVMNESGRGQVVIEMLQHLPAAWLFVPAFGLITLISYITGHCAVGYALAAATQEELGQDEDPAKWNVAFWLVLAGVVSLGLYFINPDSLKPLQTVSILTGLPLVFVVGIVVRAFIKQLKLDCPDGLPQADTDGRVYIEVDVKKREGEPQEPEEVLVTQN
jgi:BCCT family betaine/carnitine transporter